MSEGGVMANSTPEPNPGGVEAPDVPAAENPTVDQSPNEVPNQGSKGDPGKDGKDGEDGKDGKDGKDGEDGKNGEDAPVKPATKIDNDEKRKDATLARSYIGGKVYVSAVGVEAGLAFTGVNVDQGLNAVRYLGRMDAVQMAAIMQGANFSLNAVRYAKSCDLGERSSTSYTTAKSVWMGTDRFPISLDALVLSSRTAVLAGSIGDQPGFGYSEFAGAVAGVRPHRASYDSGDAVSISRGTKYSFSNGTSHSWAYGTSFSYASQTSYSALSRGKNEIIAGPYTIAYVNPRQTEALDRPVGLRGGSDILDPAAEAYKAAALSALVRFDMDKDGFNLKFGAYSLKIGMNGIEIIGDVTVTGNVNIRGSLDILGNVNTKGHITAASDITALGSIESGNTIYATGSITAVGDIKAAGDVKAGIVSLLRHQHAHAGLSGSTLSTVPEA